MGKKSTKEDKNIYFLSREEAGMTRAEAAEALYISEDRIERIEYEKSAPHPDEVLAMADCYKNPTLCNYFCAHECPIGREYVPEVKIKDLSQITLFDFQNDYAVISQHNAIQFGFIDTVSDIHVTENLCIRSVKEFQRSGYKTFTLSARHCDRHFLSQFLHSQYTVVYCRMAAKLLFTSCGLHDEQRFIDTHTFVVIVASDHLTNHILKLCDSRNIFLESGHVCRPFERRSVHPHKSGNYFAILLPKGVWKQVITAK